MIGRIPWPRAFAVSVLFYAGCVDVDRAKEKEDGAIDADGVEPGQGDQEGDAPAADEVVGDSEASPSSGGDAAADGNASDGLISDGDAGSGQDPCALLPDHAPCSDGDACTIEDRCLSGACKGTFPAACNDGNSCTDDLCLPAVGCVFSSNGKLCSDGNGCTTGDVCQNAKCVGKGTPGCACDEDADCVAFDDGDPCNGAVVCVAGSCTVDTTSVVACDTSLDGPCLITACNPSTGRCAPEIVTGGPCADGDVCTTEDTCVAGACVGETGACACDAGADCAAFEDGDLCNGALTCEGGLCSVDPSTIPPPCTSGAPCEEAACDPTSGLCTADSLDPGSPCDDGDPCTAVDVCTADSICAGAAVLSEPPSCNGVDEDCDGATDEDCSFRLTGFAFGAGFASSASTEAALFQTAASRAFAGTSTDGTWTLHAGLPEGGSP